MSGFSIRQELGTDGDHFLPGLHPHDGNRTLVSRAQLHFAQPCCPFCRCVLAPPSLQTDGSEGYGTMAAERN